MDDLKRLVAIEEIKQLSARRVRYMDLKQWSRYGSVHTEDACSEAYGDAPPGRQGGARGEGNKVVGPAALTAAIRDLMDGPAPITSCHHLHQPEIEFTSDTTATAIWPMEDHLWWQNGETREYLHGYGHYHEQYRKVDGTWLICYRKLTRLKLDMSPNFANRPGN